MCTTLEENTRNIHMTGGGLTVTFLHLLIHARSRGSPAGHWTSVHVVASCHHLSVTAKCSSKLNFFFSLLTFFLVLPGQNMSPAPVYDPLDTTHHIVKLGSLVLLSSEVGSDQYQVHHHADHNKIYYPQTDIQQMHIVARSLLYLKRGTTNTAVQRQLYNLL